MSETNTSKNFYCNSEQLIQLDLFKNKVKSINRNYGEELQEILFANNKDDHTKYMFSSSDDIIEKLFKEEEIEFILKNKIQTYYYTDRDYPFRLKECSDSPLMLFSKGNCDLNAGKFVGIVGTRNATEAGKENCRKLIFDLAAAQPNTVIVSGMAYGIDICAHKAALDAGLTTIGVVGHGLDRLYPAAHRKNTGGIGNAWRGFRCRCSGRSSRG